MADGILAPCSVACGSRMTCHWIRPNVRHIGILHLVSISITSPQSTCHSAHQVCEILPKSDHPRQKKITLSLFSRRRISGILDFTGSIMSSLKSPCTTSYRSSIETMVLNCLVFFEKITFYCILATDGQTIKQTDRQTDRKTDEQMDVIDALNRSGCRERRLNNKRVRSRYCIWKLTDSHEASRDLSAIAELLVTFGKQRPPVFWYQFSCGRGHPGHVCVCVWEAADTAVERLRKSG